LFGLSKIQNKYNFFKFICRRSCDKTWCGAVQWNIQYHIIYTVYIFFIIIFHIYLSPYFGKHNFACDLYISLNRIDVKFDYHRRYIIRYILKNYHLRMFFRIDYFKRTYWTHWIQANASDIYVKFMNNINFGQIIHC
jgi:hypothetical protein